MTAITIAVTTSQRVRLQPPRCAVCSSWYVAMRPPPSRLVRDDPAAHRVLRSRRLPGFGRDAFDAAVPDRVGEAGDPLLSARRRPLVEGSGRLEPRAPPAVDALGKSGAADARREGRAAAPVPRPVRPRRGLRLRRLR